MNAIKYKYTLSVIVLSVILSFTFTGCKKDDTTPNQQFTGQQETFPGVIKEDWNFYNSKGDLTVSEVWTYKYENGKRVSCIWYRSKEVQIKDSIIHSIDKDITIQKYTTIAANFAELKYNYNEKGNLVSENWQVKPAPPVASWMLTYAYNSDGTKIIGASVPGMSNLIYEYDDKGRRYKTSITFLAGASGWSMTHKYNEEGKCIMASGTVADGRHIVVLYTY